MTKRLEVHEHSWVSGPDACYAGLPRGRIVHSHEGGDRPHCHPDTGPASYTIDRDDWLRATGMVGGGKKQFTARPLGPQLPLHPVESEKQSFEVIFAGPPPAGFKGEGAGDRPVIRMMLQHKMKPRLRLVK